MTTHALVAFVLASTAVAQGANLIANGSFETGPGTTSNTTVYSPSTVFTGWLVFTGSVDQVAEWTAAAGVYSLDMDGLSVGGIRQTVATSPGGIYRLTFKMAGNPGTGIKNMRVSIGATQHVVTFDATSTTSSNMGWSLRTFTFPAGGTSTTIEFLSLSASGSTGPALDDVVLQQIGSGAAFFQPFGAGCSGTSGVPSIFPVQPPRIGQPLSAVLLNVPANEFAAAMVGFDYQQYPAAVFNLAGLGMPTCSLYSLPQILDVIPSTGPFSACVWGTVLPNNPSTVGTGFILQFLVHDPAANAGGFVVSDAALGVVGN
jgi:choice-of-anchor C domain-containing protein